MEIQTLQHCKTAENYISEGDLIVALDGDLTVVENLCYQKYLLSAGNKHYFLSAEGRFKLIEWENLQKTRATARWTIVIAVASVIAAGVASWFSWQDSLSDQDWQAQQLKLLQKISEK